jgi:hypothetical protein
MSNYAHPAGCMHKSSVGTDIEGVRPNYFALAEGGIADKGRPIEIEFLGSVYQEVVHEGVDSNGFQFAELRIVYFVMEGQHPNYGKLRISHDNTRPGTRGVVKSTVGGQKFPAIHTTYLNVVGVADKVPGVLLQNAGAPLVFVSAPMNDWPPVENIYRLTTAVEFEARYDPGRAVMNISPAIVKIVKAV